MAGLKWERTTTLRFLRPFMFGMPDHGKLQQAWQCPETGEIEWRDVEIVTEEYQDIDSK